MSGEGGREVTVPLSDPAPVPVTLGSEEHEELWAALTGLTTRTASLEGERASGPTADELALTLVQVGVELTVTLAERRNLDGDEMRAELHKFVALLRELARPDGA